MNRITTVQSDINLDEMGFTLMHEHLCIVDWNLRISDPEFFDYDKTLSSVVEVLNNAKKTGVNTVVDATTSNLGRDIKLLSDASRITGMNIIASAGLYLLEGGLMRYISDQSLLDMILKEVYEGIGDTSIKAGIIKAATGEAGLTKDNIRCLQACGKAAAITGLPIITHCRPPKTRQGLFQLDIFEEQGVDLSKVVIGHYRNGDSISYAKEIAARGAFIGIDQMNFNEHQIEFNKRRIKELVDLGLEDHLILSHDAVINYHYDSDKRENLHNYINYSPDSLSYLATKGTKHLLDAGISQETINKIFYENPRKVFKGNEL